jgi:hypothetical protein
MITLEQFRSGEFSLPSSDLDEIPALCLSCSYLAYKEFSVGDGIYYYFCGYYWGEGFTRTEPPCLGGLGPEGA